MNDPVALLAACRARLKPGGAVYVALPDGEAALAQKGPQRQEFFIDHVTVWSPGATECLIRAAGFTPGESGRLREPSGKFTLFAFALFP
ncbi:class I SAM-dependent methyltransferase [Fundidesulfovibrio butyratiphilus]